MGATMNLGNRYQQALAGAGTQGQRADEDFYRRAQAFDPYAAVRDSARGSYNLFASELDKQIGRLRGQQVGMGRFDSSLATREEDDLVREGRDRLSDSILANSMGAAQMDLSRTGMLGSYAGQQQQQYYDLLAGGLDRETAAANAKRQSRDSLLGGALKLAGTFLPGAGLVKKGVDLLGTLPNPFTGQPTTPRDPLREAWDAQAPRRSLTAGSGYSFARPYP